MEKEAHGDAKRSGRLDGGFYTHLRGQLYGAIWCPDPQNEEVMTRYVKAAIDRLNDIRPEGAVEGMLAVQMIAAHDAALHSLTMALNSPATLQVKDFHLKHAVKLMTLYERQITALDKRRGRGRQNVTVKNVHVAEGGQAIVGNVSHGGNAKAPESADPLALPAPDEPPIGLKINDDADAALRMPAERESDAPDAPSKR